MITNIKATNFRRHEELELAFDADAQLILIAGANGAGKSTILEAIHFGLWGESRHGRRNLDTLIRRGAELEGMSAEVTFTLGDDCYRVHRRRDGKSSTAVLYCNDMPLVEGARQVSEEVGRIMGMDAAGFRLAVTAQQKDLDGLASLRPAERAQMISRLLRLDVINAAKQAANQRLRTERAAVQALAVDDLEQLRAEQADIDQQLAGARQEQQRAAQELAVLDAELAAGSDVEAIWQQAQQQVARLEGSLEQVRSRQTQLQAQRDGLTVPAAPQAQPDLAQLTRQVSEVERRIAVAEAAQQQVRQRATVASELEQIDQRLETISQRRGTLADAQSAEDAAGQEVRTAAEEEAARTAAEQARSRVVALTTSLNAAQQAFAATDELGAVCDACGQQITDEHRQQQQQRLASEVEQLTGQLADAQQLAQAAADQATQARAAAAAARHAHEQARARALELSRLEEEQKELKRRQQTYRSQLERLPTAAEHPDELYATKAQLSVRVTEATEAADAQRRRTAALERHQQLTDELDRTNTQLGEVEQQLAQARPSAELTARYQQLREQADRRQAEAELVAHFDTQIAALAERRDAAAQRVATAERTLQRRDQHQQVAVHAAAAVRLLGDVGEQLATQIRPALEGAVGTLLDKMSDGRFTAVQISDEYAIDVLDDGKFRPLSELSGGEVDLVALAVRLALAQVVSARHGSGGAGFLILDECFGSQDPSRRRSVLEALRGLRDTYQQIFLISHVENIEDAADVVVSVAYDHDTGDGHVLVS